MSLSWPPCPGSGHKRGHGIAVERGREPPGVVGAGAVVDVAHRRGDVRVPEHGLNVGEGERLDRHRAELVAQIMEADRGHVGAAADVNPVGGEVHVTPAKRPQLALAKAGVRRGEVEGGVLEGWRGADQRAELLGGEGHERAAVADGRAVDEIGRRGITRQPVPAHREPEHAMGHGEMAYYRPSAQPRSEQLIAQRLDVLGGDRVDRELALRGSR